MKPRKLINNFNSHFGALVRDCACSHLPQPTPLIRTCTHKYDQLTMHDQVWPIDHAYNYGLMLSHFGVFSNTSISSDPSSPDTDDCRWPWPSTSFGIGLGSRILGRIFGRRCFWWHEWWTFSFIALSSHSISVHDGTWIWR